MKFTVRYIPLDRIRPAAGEERASRMLRLRRLWWDCAHLLAVRPDGRSGRYVLLRGHTRYDYLTRRTNRKVAACLVDDGGAEPPRRLSLLPGRRLLEAVRPLLDGERMTPASWAVVRLFLAREPRFARLTLAQKARILLMAVRYKRTTVAAMRAAVDRMLAAARRSS